MKKTVECKSLGIPLTEEVARQIDELCKKLPQEQRSLKRKGALPDATELVSGERADISMVSVESVDRDGEVVLAKGMNTDYFSKNPIVTFAHKYDELPVGKAQWIKKVQGGIKAKTVYSDATDIARSCWQMTQEGILKGKSIGFLPTVIRSPSSQEISRNPAWKNASAVVESAVLLEYAIAPIPVNQDALVEAVSKGLADKATLKRLGFAWQEKELSQQDIAALITREFQKWAKELSPERIRQKLLDEYRA